MLNAPTALRVEDSFRRPLPDILLCNEYCRWHTKAPGHSAVLPGDRNEMNTRQEGCLSSCSLGGGVLSSVSRPADRPELTGHAVGMSGTVSLSCELAPGVVESATDLGASRRDQARSLVDQEPSRATRRRDWSPGRRCPLGRAGRRSAGSCDQVLVTR
jgi:hypothetical protein